MVINIGLHSFLFTLARSTTLYLFQFHSITQKKNVSKKGFVYQPVRTGKLLLTSLLFFSLFTIIIAKRILYTPDQGTTSLYLRLFKKLLYVAHKKFYFCTKKVKEQFCVKHFSLIFTFHFKRKIFLNRIKSNTNFLPWKQGFNMKRLEHHNKNKLCTSHTTCVENILRQRFFFRLDVCCPSQQQKENGEVKWQQECAQDFFYLLSWAFKGMRVK